MVEVKKKKVWIMTRRAGYNFGSSLQAYAITYIIDKLGFKNEIINYEEYRFQGKVRLFFFSFLAITMQHIPFLEKYIIPRFYNRIVGFYYQRKKFDAFEKGYLPLTLKRYKSSQQLVKAAKDCDILICGSDQIWSPIHFCPAMFLNFADASTKTIAYAPSMGISKIDQNQDEIRKLIQKIDFLSVRELQGAKLIKELTGREALVVLDPTLLLQTEEWEKIAISNSIQNPYILSYFLDSNIIPFDFIDSLRLKTGYQVINLLTNYSQVTLPYANNMSTVSPGEFLSLIKNASYICTNSFHGTIFSIQFKKEFYVFNRFTSDSNINQNSRIETLLSSVGLINRLIPFNHTLEKFSRKINYESVYENLDKLRDKSLVFLKEALFNFNK